MAKQSEFYLHATSNTCYDRTGVTFPVVTPIAWNAILTEVIGAENMSEARWENQFGWFNQPEVLIFPVPDLIDPWRLVERLHEICPQSFVVHPLW